MSEAPRVSIPSLLRGASLFRGVSGPALARLEAASRLRRLARGQLLFNQGDAADAFFLVCSGSIDLGLDSANGRELVINEMRRGDCLGELGLLTGQPRSAAALASVDSEVLVMPRNAFWAVLDAAPAVVQRLLQMTASRLRSSSEREGALAFMDAQARLARLLLHLDEQPSDKDYVTISQAELGRRAGLTRQTVAQILGRWRRRGWLVTGRGRIMLLDAVRLAQLAKEPL